VFETIYADPARLKEFLKAMTGVSHGANLAIAAKFPWANTRRLWIRAGAGRSLTQVLLKNQHLQAWDSIWRRWDRSSRVCCSKRIDVAAAFQREVSLPMRCPKADVVMMGHILHDWNSTKSGCW